MPGHTGPLALLVNFDHADATRPAAEQALRAAGFALAEAATAGAALARAGRADLVLLLASPALADDLRRLKADPATALAPVLCLSDSAGERVAALRGGADACLPASAAPDELAATAQALVRARRGAEGALRRSEGLFRALATHAPVGIFLTDADGRCLLVNERWCALAGMTPEQARGDGWADALHPEDRERVAREWSEAARQGREFASQYRFVTPEGRVSWLAGGAVGLRDEAGRVTGHVGTLTDITALKQAGEALRQADRRKDEFLAMLAHELRGPLAPLSNALQLVRLRSGEPSAVEQAGSLAERQVRQLARLVDDLLDVSRVARGKLQIVKQRVDVAGVVAQAVETARPLIEARGHELNVLLPPEPLGLEADPARLVQILSNLLSNAARYTAAGGKVWLSAERDGSDVVFRVRDTGVGLTPEMLPRVFELFAQAQHGAQGGLGVGLALVRGLAELHGGSVVAYSGGPGEGSEFVVSLPGLPHGQAFAEPPPPQAAAPVPPRRCLVVDDNIDAAESLAMLLRLSGHEVEVAHDGVTAMELARLRPPEVALLDIGLPAGMDGHELARRLRREPGLGGIVLVALTGFGQEDDRRRALEAGFDHFAVKPVEVQTLDCLLGGVESEPRERGAEL